MRGRMRELAWAPMMMRHAHRQEGQARLQGAVAEHVLQVQREEIPHREEAPPRSGTSRCSRPQTDRDRNSPKRHQRVRATRSSMIANAASRTTATPQQRQRGGAAPRVSLGADDRVDQRPQPGRDGDRACRRPAATPGWPRGRRPRDSGSQASAATTAATPIGMFTNSTQRHDSAEVSTPPRIEPAAPPAPATALQMPRARVRRSPEKVVTMIVSVAGDRKAPADALHRPGRRQPGRIP